MKILAFSDWRWQTSAMLESLIREKDPDLILYAGDDLERVLPLGEKILLRTNHKNGIEIDVLELQKDKFFHPNISKEAVLFLKEFINELNCRKGSLHNFKVPYFFVNGNDDKTITFNGSYYLLLYSHHNLNFFTCSKILTMTKAGEILLTKSNRKSRDQHALKLYTSVKLSHGHHTFSKSGETISISCIGCPFGLPKEATKIPKKYADIYLSHLPPYGSLDLSIRYGNEHVGSKKLRTAITELQPKLVICGHSHLWGGKQTNIGNTQVANVSSHDQNYSDGNYAVIDTKTWSVVIGKIPQNQFRRIAGIRDAKRLFTCHDLPDTYDEILQELNILEQQGVSFAQRVRQRVESTQWSKPKIIKKVTINPNNQAFVDVETGSFRGNKPGSLWLIGLLNKGKLVQFKIPEEEGDFLAFLKKHAIRSLASWTEYDKRSLQKVFGAKLGAIRFLDVCDRIRKSIIWHTYELEQLHEAIFGPTSVFDDISGMEAGVYADHLIIPQTSCPYCPPVDKIEVKIRNKNANDLFQMHEICAVTHA